MESVGRTCCCGYFQARSIVPAKEKFDAVKDYTTQWKGSNAQADQHLVLRAVLLAMSQPS